MEECLALDWAAGEISRCAMFLQLGHVPRDLAPPPDLSRILGRDAPPHIVAAVPLEPATGVIWVDPALGSPNREWLARIYAKKIQRRVMSLVAKLRLGEPVGRVLCPAISHVFAAKDAEGEHFFGGELRGELGVKIFAHRGDKLVAVVTLHQVIHYNDSRHSKIILHATPIFDK